MDVTDAYQAVTSTDHYDYGKFFSVDTSGALGVGQIFDGIRYPVFDKNDALFDTVEGLVYLLTHECDISMENERPFNDYLMLCPIFSLENCITELSASLSDESLLGFLANLGADRVSRVVYIPPLLTLKYGGIMYLNQISHTHISSFNSDDATQIASVTSYGLRIIDYKVTNHLLRPKTANLPLMQY